MTTPTQSRDSMKFWAILTLMLLIVAVIVTFVDLTIKASILAESNSLKLAMEDWEVRNGPKQAGRIDERNPADNSHNGHLPGDVLGTGNAGLETGGSDSGIPNTIPARPRKRPVPRPSDGN